VKIAVQVAGADALRRLAKLQQKLTDAALDAAADALVREAERAREAAGLAGPLTSDDTARRRLIGSRDPAAVAQELGTLDRPPAPWLAPVLPAASSRMRAAAVNAVARAILRVGAR
jgi:hypothetical protein